MTINDVIKSLLHFCFYFVLNKASNTFLATIESVCLLTVVRYVDINPERQMHTFSSVCQVQSGYSLLTKI